MRPGPCVCSCPECKEEHECFECFHMKPEEEPKVVEGMYKRKSYDIDISTFCTIASDAMFMLRVIISSYVKYWDETTSRGKKLRELKKVLTECLKEARTGISIEVIGSLRCDDLVGCLDLIDVPKAEIPLRPEAKVENDRQSFVGEVRTIVRMLEDLEAEQNAKYWRAMIKKL